VEDSIRPLLWRSELCGAGGCAARAFTTIHHWNGVVEREQEKDMNRLRSAAVLFGLLAAAGVAQAQDFKQRFVGRSPCAPDIQSELSDFSLRLDKEQDLSLLYRDLSAVKVVMIIEPTSSGDHCGVIRDVVQITHIAKDFEFRCFDPQAATDVTIGTAIRKGSTKPVTAIDAWRIDLKEQKFIETRDKVTCTAEGWAGEDDGSDLVDEAKKRAAHDKSGQFESEPNDTQGAPVVRVRVEGELRKAKLIEGVLPIYPEEGLRNRVTGTVELHVVFEKGGTVRLAEVVSGHPLFAQAAMDAVRHWKYPPTMLNGKPVEVDTLVFVTFALNGP
jgi:TonB family protein